VAQSTSTNTFVEKLTYQLVLYIILLRWHTKVSCGVEVKIRIATIVDIFGHLIVFRLRDIVGQLSNISTSFCTPRTLLRTTVNCYGTTGTSTILYKDSCCHYKYKDLRTVCATLTSYIYTYMCMNKYITRDKNSIGIWNNIFVKYQVLALQEVLQSTRT
jgi:hypothetical protein